MRTLLLLLLVTFAAASLHEELENAADEFLASFIEGMEKAPPLKDFLCEFDNEYADAVEEETKAEIVKRLKEVLIKNMKRVKNAIAEGNKISEKQLQKIKNIEEKLKDLNVDLGDKDFVKTLVENLLHDKRAVADNVEEALADININDILKQLKQHLKDTVDPDLLKEKIEKVLGQGSELLRQLLQTLREKGKNKLMMLIDFLLDDDEDGKSKRSISEYWDKLKDYFKGLKIDLQEKYMKFGEWVKTAMDKGMEHSKDKMENIKAIAREFAKHAKGISKEVAAEAGEFFKNYKDELGNLWDEVKERLQEIRNRKD